jgi:hypothetical protein
MTLWSIASSLAMGIRDMLQLIMTGGYGVDKVS